MSNYWDDLMGTDEGAAQYMDTYGEGPGCETRQIISGLIHDGESVLDVGCGPGWNLDQFLEYGPQVGEYLGLDYSERFVRVANRRFHGKYGDNSVDFFKVGDCRNLKQPNESYDVVILQDVLEHTNGYEKPVKEALRVARKRVIITFWKSFRNPGDGDQTNDDGNDGYGSNYEQKPWEDFLDSLGYAWVSTETSPQANRWHKYYIITKEGKQGWYS
jgi:ubiquinone/menaquinone biosynthesis C-methylase UbiE